MVCDYPRSNRYWKRNRKAKPRLSNKLKRSIQSRKLQRQWLGTHDCESGEAIKNTPYIDPRTLPEGYISKGRKNFYRVKNVGGVHRWVQCGLPCLEQNNMIHIGVPGVRRNLQDMLEAIEEPEDFEYSDEEPNLMPADDDLGLETIFGEDVPEPTTEEAAIVVEPEGAYSDVEPEGDIQGRYEPKWWNPLYPYSENDHEGEIIASYEQEPELSETAAMEFPEYQISEEEPIMEYTHQLEPIEASDEELEALLNEPEYVGDIVNCNVLDEATCGKYKGECAWLDGRCQTQYADEGQFDVIDEFPDKPTPNDLLEEEVDQYLGYRLPNLSKANCYLAKDSRTCGSFPNCEWMNDMCKSRSFAQDLESALLPGEGVIPVVYDPYGDIKALDELESSEISEYMSRDDPDPFITEVKYDRYGDIKALDELEDQGGRFDNMYKQHMGAYAAPDPYYDWE